MKKIIASFVLLFAGLVASNAFAAGDLGMTKAEFLQRFNAQVTKKDLPPLPAEPVQVREVSDSFGPAKLSIYPIGSLVIILHSYDASPDRVSSLALMNLFDDVPENEELTVRGVDSLLNVFAPNNRSAIRKGLGIGNNLKGISGKTFEHTSNGFRFVLNAQKGQGISLAVYPVL